MGYVTAYIMGHEIEVSVAEVIECMEFFQCSYVDALYHVGYSEYCDRSEYHTHGEYRARKEA